MLKKLTKITLLALGLTPLAFAADASEENRVEVADYWRGIAEFQHANNQTNGFALDSFVPIYGNLNEFWYVNAQVYSYDKLYRTYSLGLGHRQRVKDSVYGAYVFYDRQRSAEEQYYDRINVGIERMDKDWSFRYNLYWYGSPKIKTLTDTTTSANIIGNNIVYTENYMIEEVYSGMSADIGYHFDEGLSVHAGYYTYGQLINGSKIGIEYDMVEHVTLKAGAQYDTARGWLTSFSLSYWFGNHESKDNSILDRMRAPVYRDMTVAAYTHEEDDTTVDSRSIYFVNGDANNGLGTQADAMTLQNALAASKAGDFIYLDNGSGTDIDMDGQAILKANQTVTSSAEDLTVSHNGQSFTLLQGDTAARPTLVNGGFLVNHAASLSGFNMNGDNSLIKSGIAVSSDGDVQLKNLVINNYNTDATYEAVSIESNNGSTVTIDDLTANNNAFGVTIGASNGLSNVNVIMNNANITDSSSSAISIIGENTAVTINNSNLIDSAESALVARQNASAVLNDVTVRGQGSSALLFAETGATILANNSALETTDINASDLMLALTGGQITIDSPTELIGWMNASGTGSKITVKTSAGNYISEGGQWFQCSIDDGAGSCVP